MQYTKSGTNKQLRKSLNNCNYLKRSKPEGLLLFLYPQRKLRTRHVDYTDNLSGSIISTELPTSVNAVAYANTLNKKLI